MMEKVMQGDIDEYARLLLFASVNIAVLFIRRTALVGVIAYLGTLVLLYATSIFFLTPKSVAVILYCLASGYLIIWKKKLVLINFVLINLFLCLVVISNTAGNSGGLTLSMFFRQDPVLPLLNTVSDTADIATVFMGYWVPIYILTRLFMYFLSIRKKKDIKSSDNPIH